MLRALTVAGLFLVGGASAADKPEQTPAALLSFIKAAGERSTSPTKERLLRAVSDTEAQLAATAPERHESVIESRLLEINAAAAVAADGRLNDAMSQFNNAAGHYREALGFADRALAQDPKDARALVNRSVSQVGLNRYDDAYADADRALKLNPDDAGALRARAMAAYKLRHFMQAQEDARKALALNPNDRSAYYIMQLAEAKVPNLKLDKFQGQLAGEVQREYHGMVQQLNQLNERAPELPTEPARRPVETLLASAKSKLKLRDFAGAVADADRALALDPDSASAYYYRAAAYNLAGRHSEAAEDATRALMLDPTDVRARDTRAWAYNNLSRFRDAIADSNHSLEINPDNAYAYWNLGYAREHTGDLGGMMSALKTASKLSPQFEPAFRDAAARHGLDGPRSEEPQPAPSEKTRRRSFVVVIVSSVLGGVLIAAGILQLYGDKRVPPPGAPALSTLRSAYILGQPIGKGGMGVVYEAFDKTLQRAVAVKIMRPETLNEPRARERFLEEARTVAALHHPAIVDIHAIVEDKDGLCLVFERIEGRTLEEVLVERGRLPLAEARALLKPICQGLEFAHRHSVVHRDLKPGNIMVTTGGQVKLMDFGISRHERRTLHPLLASERATAAGTPYYMAPEQEYGEVRRESDVYSLGCCLYEMLTGQRPFLALHAMSDKLARRYHKPSKLVPGLPTAVDDLIDHALNPDPHERLRTPADFLALLERAGATAAVG